MVNDTIFREKVEQQLEKPEEVKIGDKAGTQISNIEPPYTDYEKVHNHPYLVDHFKLGDTWRDKLGGFEKEISLIEGYFKDKINEGQMKNEKEAVQEQLKKIYRLCNIDKTERTTMQIEKLAAYIEFLRKTDLISLNHYKYGNQ